MAQQYPQEVALRDGRRVLLRPFTANDVGALKEFFQRQPAEAKRLAWDRVDDPALIEAWGRNLDYTRAFPLVAVDGARIVADATLHRRDGGPLRLVGRVRHMVDPEWRHVGLSTILMNHFISVAREFGLRHLSTLLVSDLESDAVKVLSDLGFTKTVLPGYGADADGGAHDMTYLVLKL